jgi:hypothetical protein
MSKLGIPNPQDMAKIVKNRAIRDLCQWATDNAAQLCGESGLTRSYVNSTQLKFDQALLEQAGWICEERKAIGHYRCGYDYDLVISAKPGSFQKMPNDLYIISPLAIWETLQDKCERNVQEAMKLENFQDKLFIYGKNVTFKYDTEKEAEISKDILERNGWTIILAEELVIVWSPLHKTPFLE